MRRIHLLSTVLGTVLLASPALAQRDTMSEMHRGQGSSASPSVPMQNHNAGMADEMGANSPTQWFKEAHDALRRGQTGQASELLERAETRLLNRSLMGSGEQASQGPVVRHSAAARQALAQRDRSTAMREIDMAMNAARDMRGDRMGQTGMGQSGMGMQQSSGFNSGSMATGSSTANQSMESGGPSMGRSARGQAGMQVQPGPAPGSVTARDHGMGGSSMSRADLIILAQGGGGGGQSPSAETGYPGSPSAGATSTPQNPGASTQGTAVPGVPTEGRGPPVPGGNRPAMPGQGNAGPAPMPGGGTTPMR